MVRFSTGSSYRDDGQSPSKRLKSFFSSDDEPSHTQFADERSSVGPSHLKRSASSSSANIPNTSPSMHSSSSSFSCSGPVFLDLDTLDCNICMEVLSAPIFQCSNGHYACSKCTEKLYEKCPSCLEPVGKIRNLGLEKILESVKVFCKFSDSGCPEGLLPYATKKIHEQRCIFSPHDCPLRNCTFNGPLVDFKGHFKDCHNVKTLSFCYNVCFTLSFCLEDSYVLLHGDDDTFFLFQIVDQGYGKLVYISSLLPLSIGQLFPYQLDAKFCQSHLTLVSTIQTHGYNKVNLDKMEFLLVPRCYFTNERFQVEVTIKHCVQRG